MVFTPGAFADLVRSSGHLETTFEIRQGGIGNADGKSGDFHYLTYRLNCSLYSDLPYAASQTASARDRGFFRDTN